METLLVILSPVAVLAANFAIIIAGLLATALFFWCLSSVVIWGAWLVGCITGKPMRFPLGGTRR